MDMNLSTISNTIITTASRTYGSFNSGITGPSNAFRFNSYLQGGKHSYTDFHLEYTHYIELDGSFLNRYAFEKQH